VDLNYKPRRLNKVIELWEDGQPIYYTGSGTGPGVDPYVQGKKMAKTYADAINYEMEHGALDFAGLREFMRGLADGGPTRSGHRFPAVFVSPPAIGLDETYMRVNSWMLSQILDAGVMGVHICHARDPKAIEVAAHEAIRYPFEYPNTPKMRLRGIRGSSADWAAHVWGIPGGKYCHIADIWPLNPRGELFFGVKIEDAYADENCEKVLAVPGIAMAEWGPGDHNYFIGGLESISEDGPSFPDDEGSPKMAAMRARVLASCKKHNIKFLNAVSTTPGPTYIIDQIKDGAMVMAGGGEETAMMGREFTKRKMPV
jgi:4-hydroxy-2-oxoheptanedioate aldolase